ncbi:UNVERIFIED_CONTAM: hypothetical protein FKN15_017235 [Acipenser sinensis]
MSALQQTQWVPFHLFVLPCPTSSSKCKAGCEPVTPHRARLICIRDYRAFNLINQTESVTAVYHTTLPVSQEIKMKTESPAPRCWYCNLLCMVTTRAIDYYCFRDGGDHKTA